MKIHLSRQTSLIVVFTALFLVADVAPANADAIWLFGESDPIFGLVVNRDEQAMRFNQTHDGVSFKTVTLKLSSVQSMVINFDVDRLQSLSPDRLKDYRDYAEELTSQAKDPVARRLALRLFVIVAGNSKDRRVRDAALASIVGLANSEEERRRWKTLYYLETGNQGSMPRDPSDRTGSPAELSSVQQRRELVGLLQSLRKGETVRFESIAPSLRETASLWSEVCSWEELVQISKSNFVNDEQLQRIVAFEYEIRKIDQQPAPDAHETSSPSVVASWPELANRIAIDRVEIPSIRNATQFDPRQSIFRDGKWRQK